MPTLLMPSRPRTSPINFSIRCLEGDHPLPWPCAPVGFSTTQRTFACWPSSCATAPPPISSSPATGLRFKPCSNRATVVCLAAGRSGFLARWAMGVDEKQCSVFVSFSVLFERPARTARGPLSAWWVWAQPWNCSPRNLAGGVDQPCESGGTSPTPK